MAGTSQNGQLSSGQLAQLARATLDNAQSLLEDARLLLDAGRWARAYALTILAAEEYGKFESCVIAGSYESDDHDSWKRFWKDFRDHKPKLTTWAGTFVDFVFTLPTMAHEEWVGAWNNRSEMVLRGLRGKKAAFYVDYTDGEVTCPASEFTEDTATNTFGLVHFMVTIQAQTFQGDLTRLVSPSAELRAVLGDMQRAKSAADRDASAKALLRFLERKMPTADLSALRAAAAQRRVKIAPKDDTEPTSNNS